MLLLVAVPVGIAVLLVLWEAHAFTNNRPLPSDKIRHTFNVIRAWTERLGFWLARLLNPMYYFDFFMPYLRPYIDAIKRIVVAMMPNHFPGYHFLKGFFTEYHGYIAALITFLAGAYYLFQHEEVCTLIMIQFQSRPWIFWVNFGGTIVVILLLAAVMDLMEKQPVLEKQQPVLEKQPLKTPKSPKTPKTLKYT